MIRTQRILAVCGAACLASSAMAGVQGYFRTPAIAAASPGGWSGSPSDEVIVFVTEGDLWKVSIKGGVATRLTTHPGEESAPVVSADGTLVAFNAQYEGITDIYTMPIAGGLPTRRTWDGSATRGNAPTSWTHDGKLIYGTSVYSTLPNAQLVMQDLATGTNKVVPLAQAADGWSDPENGALIFTRLPWQGSNTKRYKGGTAQQIWRWDGKEEAVPLTKDYDGTSKRPMVYKSRVYFASDRDGTMNIWSMKEDGSDLKQHTHHEGWDVIFPNLSVSSGIIVYQLGADIWKFDITSDKGAMVPIALESDFDQQREKWIKKPLEWLTAAHISREGDKVALTARGQVFIAQARQGRLVELSQFNGSRVRDARFLKDSSSVVALTDKSGEVELWTAPANGVGEAGQLTSDATVLRWEAVPSGDGKYIVHHDKDQRLWLYDVERKSSQQIDQAAVDNFESIAWSPDSMFIAYVEPAENFSKRIKIYSIADGSKTYATSDRYDSNSPAWSPDGKWLYFLSDRHLHSTVGSPWGPLQPEPFFDNRTKIYGLALKTGQRWPFAANDEVQQAKDEAEKARKKDEKKEPAPEEKSPERKPAPAEEPKPADAKPESKELAKEPAKEPARKDEKDKKVKVEIQFDGIVDRLQVVPVEPGNYDGLSVNDKTLFWTSRPSGVGSKRSLQGLTITNESPEVKTVLADLASYELSGDGKKLLVRKGDTLAIIDAAAAPADLAKKDINLAGWEIALDPRTEWHQMFTESWRLMRDYFYDPAMHGVNWKAMKAKYEPLVDRVSNRVELADIMSQMVGELSALHHFVRPGDSRKGPDTVGIATLGAVCELDRSAGGHRVVHIYRNDPQEPDQAGPLARPGVDIKEGDIIELVNGVPTVSVPELRAALRDKSDVQVLLRVKSPLAAGGFGPSRDVIVNPIDAGRESDLRYDEWELTRREMVEKLGSGDIGYVHLRAMGEENIDEWAKNFYPVFNRKGLILDVRHNRGGNIDSWILEKLLRKAWMYWSQRVGHSPNWNMQYAFRGHVVLLCNEFSASDGEAVSEGFKRLGIGTTIGTRTWGGEIWLSSSNILVDRGIATASEMGVFSLDGRWLIEGRGFEPDIVVDNLPHATFMGEDAQIKAAVEHLQKQIKDHPVDQPPIPAYPDKSHPTNR